MAELRRFELDDLLVRPGTYFNPQTEVLVVVDDSVEMDQAVFHVEEAEAPEGAEWVLVSDELPVDEAERDELLERFQVAYHPGGPATVGEDGDDAPVDRENDDPDADPEDDED